jgi:hypothetical protein
MEKNFRIETDSPFSYIRVSNDDDGVWVTYWFHRGHVNAVLTKEQTRQMIVALQTLIAEEQSA